MSLAAVQPVLDCSVELRKERWRSFLSPNAAPGFMFLVRFQDPDDTRPPAPPKWPDHKTQRVERIWDDYERSLHLAEWLNDDTVPCLNMLTGTEIFAEAFGCAVHRPEDNMPFAKPLIHSADEVSNVKVPELSTSSLAYLFDMADELQRRAGPDAIFRLVDIQSPMDIAALIWEKGDFLLALLEEPEAVKELAGKVRVLLIAFLDEWFKRYGTEYVAHFPDYFMTGGMTLSEDEIGVVNSDMFVEFFLPELTKLSEHFGGMGIHCCADSRHQWENFKKVPDLRLLNLSKPPTRGPEFIQDSLRYFADHCAQWPGLLSPEGPVETWPSQYPQDARVVFEVGAKSRGEAIAIADKLNAVRGG